MSKPRFMTPALRPAALWPAALILALLLAVVTACTPPAGPASTPTPWPTTAIQSTPRPAATDSRGIARPGATAGVPYDARDLVQAGDGTLYAACRDGD
ncbi:MAG: hypothetical protein KKA73_09105, partial [Chloroflexi bacterium]|nr:hypothetical protein [Chloroflexota bacterium]